MSHLITPAKLGVRPRRSDIQAAINAILYILGAGCAWRILPSDFPCCKTYTMKQLGALTARESASTINCTTWVRVSEDRNLSPSAAILDSQSVKTATPATTKTGYDTAKQTKGCKLNWLVDTLVLMVVVTAANVPERAGAKLTFARLQGVLRWVHRAGCELGR